MHPTSRSILDPSEQIAAVLTGWAITWAMMQFGIPAFPSIAVGAIVYGLTRGVYRRRWLPAGPGRPDPGE